MSDNRTRAGQPEPEMLPEEPLGDDELSGALEALLLMAEEPVAAVVLAEAVREPLDRVTATLAELAAFYDRTRRGFELRHLAGGWRYYTRAEHAGLISRWVIDGRHANLSQAALETLAVVAYLQPISRARVSAVRGVSVDGVIRTLTARGLIAESGADEHSGATLFVTTALFCEKMGLESLADLPPLAPHLPDALDLEAELARTAAEADLTDPDAEPDEPADSPDAGPAGDSDEPTTTNTPDDTHTTRDDND
ncbi:SMC-Scp complex subunit ScpB [Ammonicoccus fulvus]|uniref:SMC-Scp complex subunit ScpB n=1 Tax=Ammonicoccus fulvus TaxID=3138240 RepID=A0ABZ3FSE9_9ACTN